MEVIIVYLENEWCRETKERSYDHILKELNLYIRELLVKMEC